jgi:GT2 family glycosyltransferase
MSEIAVAATDAGLPGVDRGVTVVVITHDSAAVVGDCLRSLPDALAGLPHDVVVVDNDSADDTPAVARAALPSATVLATGANLGYAAAINAGVGHADRRDAVLVLNPDVRLAAASVAVLRAELTGRVGIAVPRLVDGHGRLQLSLRREPTVARALAEAVLPGSRAARRGLGETIVDPGRYEAPGDADWATGAVMLVRRDCLDDLGGFDESFFLYSEETDFMLRAGDAGWATRYVPSAGAVHLGGDLTSAPWLWSMRTVNRLRLHRRRHNRASTAAFLLASLAGEGLRAAGGRATSRRALRDLARRGPGIVVRPPPAPVPAGPGWICFSAQDWWYFNRAHSDFQLMRRIAERRPVLLVNSIGLRLPLPGRSSSPLKRVARKGRSVARLVRTPIAATPGFHVMTPLPLPLYRSERTRRLGALLVRAQVRLAARSLGIIGPGRPDPVITLTIPTAIDAAQGLPHSALVVNRSDKYSTFAEAHGDTIRAIEERCLAEADRVFYSARALLAGEAPLTGDRARELDHGVDVDLFVPSCSPLPADLAAIPGPRVGYFGNIRDNLVDIDLLEAVARRLPHAQLVLVGPVACPPERLAALRARPNVHLLGPRPHEEIPAYGRGFDVALMPWNDNEWIHHANPIKMKEYLALGLPVVSTDFPEVHRYDHLIRIARGHDAFVAAVDETLRDGGLGTPAGRRAAVEQATWDAAAARFLREAESVARRGPGSG